MPLIIYKKFLCEKFHVKKTDSKTGSSQFHDRGFPDRASDMHQTQQVPVLFQSGRDGEGCARRVLTLWQAA